jgi:hypothetical protein
LKVEGSQPQASAEPGLSEFNVAFTRNPAQPSTRNLNAQPSTRNLQRATFNAQPSTRNLQRATFNAQPSTRNLQRATLNPTRNLQR